MVTIGRAQVSKSRWKLSYRSRIQLWGILFILPTILFFLIFKYGPMVWAIYLSFTGYDIVTEPKYIGLSNYISIFQDPIFLQALNNTIGYIVGSTISITVLGLGLAMVINAGIRGSRFFMSSMFLTNIMPILAVCLVWRFLFHPHGLVNQFLSPLGFGLINWLTDSNFSMPAIIIDTACRFAPYFMVVFLAGLLAVPKEIYEAADIDGVNHISRFFRITFPMIAPIVFFVVVVSALLCARIFLMPFIITGGGPGGATRVLSMLIYETGFSYLKMGRAAAISVVLFLIMMGFTIIQTRLFSKTEEY